MGEAGAWAWRRGGPGARPLEVGSGDRTGDPDPKLGETGGWRAAASARDSSGVAVVCARDAGWG